MKSRSFKKIDVVIESFIASDKTIKKWVRVSLRNLGKSFIPSLEDLFRIIQAMCWCEDYKYPTGKGRKMVEEFLVDCCRKDITFEELEKKYKIPRRDESKH